MEDVLELYAEEYNPQTPVVCMDEQPIQLIKEVRQAIVANKNHAKRIDYEYERAGTANIFMMTEALSGYRRVSVRENRKKNDWAIEIGSLLESRYKDVEKVRLVCDNLNTHTAGAFYQVYPAEQARALVKKLEFHYTPKHGSWLNIAENELSVMTRQCLAGRRIGEIEKLREETSAWAKKTNEQQKGVDWQFKLDDARIKLKRLYPKIII